MTQLKALLIALVGFAAVVTTTPVSGFPTSPVPAQLNPREPPCLCWAGTIGFVCGWDEDRSPGHLTGNCDPNLAYACGGGPYPMYVWDCPSQGLSCKGGAVIGLDPGHDYCDV